MNLSTYLGTLKNALEQRRYSPHSIPFRYAMIAVSATMAFLAISVLVSPKETPHIEFLEGGSVTWLSAALMASTGALALVCSRTCHRGWVEGRLFWLMIGVGFSFFFLDELLQFHESLDRIAAMASIGPPDHFRNWNDILVIGYGVIGLIAMVIYLPEILRYRAVAELLTVGFSFYMIHTAIDSLVSIPTNWSIVLEESAKLLCVLFMALGVLAALTAMVKFSR